MSLTANLHKWLCVLNPSLVSHSTSVTPKKPQIAPWLMHRLRVSAGVAMPASRMLAVRAASSLTLAWARCRERRSWHADLRALDGLSNATRRDLGLAERLSPQLPRADHDRVRW